MPGMRIDIGSHAYLNLRKLATGAFGQYTNELHMGLETELYHLRNLGYVDLELGIGAWHAY